MRWKTILSSLVWLSISWTPSSADELHYLYRGTRVLGMGTAFTAVSNDENALFFNPAGLASTREKFRLAVLNPKIEASTDAIQFAQDLLDLEGSDISAATDLLEKHTGEHQRLAVDLFPHLLFRAFGAGIGIGLLGNAELNTDVDLALTDPELVTDSLATYGAVVGGGYTLPGDWVQVGAGLKFLFRQSVTKEFNAAALAAEDFDIADELNNGFGVGYDLGAIFHPDQLNMMNSLKFLKPTVGLSFQNIGDIDFGDAKKEVGNLAVGLAVRPDLWILETTFALDFNFLNELHRIDQSQILHFGAEARFPKVLAVQIGYQHTGITGGVSLDLWAFEIQAATYVEETEEYAGQQPDRRYSVQLGILTF